MPSMYRATVPVLIRGLKILSTLLEALQSRLERRAGVGRR